MRCTIILSMVLLSLCLAVPVSAEDVAGETGGKSLDQMSKEEILASPRWQRAEEAMEDWLSVQNLYTSDEIDRLEERCYARVEAMNTQQLRKYLREMETKLDILLSPEVQQARDWVGSYMAVLAAPHREKLQQQLPDVANMTAPQIEQAVREFLQAQQIHGQRGVAEKSRRQAEVARGREERAWQVENRDAQMQQRQQAQAERANQRAAEARRQSMQNARVQGTTTPEWYRVRRGWFGGWGWRR